MRHPFITKTLLVVLLGFTLLPEATFAVGCCVSLNQGKNAATSKDDVAACFRLLNFGNCVDYKTNNNVQTVWKDSDCASLDICEGKTPKSCCVTTNKTTGGTTCTPSPDASACNIYVQYAKAEITKKGLGSGSSRFDSGKVPRID